MSIMISEVYDAFISAGANEDKSRKAAEALTVYENRFAKMEGELLVLKWMSGFTLAAVMAVLFLLLKQH
jgi:hypothetical protein